MNLVDSSGWLSFFANTRNAARFAPPLQDHKRLIVPTVVMYEVCKVLLREKGEEAAILAQAYMQEGNVVALTADLAISASSLSLHHRLPMADSIIFATARSLNATLWTQDAHFKDMTNVRFFAA